MNAAEYRAWWETNVPAPYGFCWCGCGEQTAVPTKTNRRLGRVKGEPMRFIRGHAGRKWPTVSSSEYRRRWHDEQPQTPFGYCCCGCGEKTRTSPYTMTDRGWVKGEPKRYLHGHHGRVVGEALEGEICRRYAAGEHAGQLTTGFGCNIWSVYNALNKHGVERRSRRDVAVRYTCDHAFSSMS